MCFIVSSILRRLSISSRNCCVDFIHKLRWYYLLLCWPLIWHDQESLKRKTPFSYDPIWNCIRLEKKIRSEQYSLKTKKLVTYFVYFFLERGAKILTFSVLNSHIYFFFFWFFLLIKKWKKERGLSDGWISARPCHFFLISVSTCLSKMCPLQLAVGDL